MIAKLVLIMVVAMATGVASVARALNNRKNSTHTSMMVLFVVGLAFIVTSIMYTLTLVLFTALY